MGFQKQFEEIQKDRMGVVNSSVYPGLKNLVSEIYPEEAHFIYELLQNAEDTIATKTVFEVYEDKLVFKHNGTKQFDAADINAITNIAHSTKKDNYIQAGKFGIGFKSVYAFTENPYIYCDSICFRIESLLLPVIIDDISTREKGWTVFVLPFDSPKISAERARDKIIKGLKEIEPTTLLFLRNIKEVEYSYGNNHTYSVKSEGNGNQIFSFPTKNGVINGLKNTWLRFSKEDALNGKRFRVDIAFCQEYSEKKKQYVFKKTEDKVAITFVAKNEKSNLRFLINAPFACTPSRDSVNKDDEDNIYLIEKIGELFVEVLLQLKEEDLLSDDFYEVLPLEEDNIPEFYEPIVEKIHHAFSKYELIKTIDNKYTKVQDGFIASKKTIENVITKEDISFLWNNRIVNIVPNKSKSTRAYKILKELGIEILTADHMLLLLNDKDEQEIEEWIEKKTDEQLDYLYGFFDKGLSNFEETLERLNDTRYNYDNWEEQDQAYRDYFAYQSKINEIKNLSIIKSESGYFMPAKELYFLNENIELPEGYSVVAKFVYQNNISKRFLERMGVKEFTREELDKYRYTQEIHDFRNFLENLSGETNEPLDVAERILAFYDKHSRYEISIKDIQFVWTKGGEKFVLPKDCYLDKPYIEENGFAAAETIHNKKALDDCYLRLSEADRNKWVELLKGEGIYYDLSVESEYRSTGYSSGLDERKYIPYLNEYLKLENIKLNSTIWNFCSNMWWYDWGQASRDYYRLNQRYSTKYSDSGIVVLLRESKWLPDKQGKLHKPADISKTRLHKEFKYVEDNDSSFLKDILFGVNAKIEEDAFRREQELNRSAENEIEESLKNLGYESKEEYNDMLKRAELAEKLEALGIDIDELINRTESEKEKQKKSVDEMFDQLNKSVNLTTKDTDNDVYGVSNPERRQKKLKEQLQNNPVSYEKKASIRKQKIIDKREKIFVSEEYEGHCQICDKIIIKNNGEHYFEAINLLSTDELEDKYLIGLGIGWNTLCLCPNCAAEFKYGPVSFYDFKEEVMQTEIEAGYDEYYDFEIEMQGEARTISYTPKHLLALKTALLYFEDQKHTEDKVEQQLLETNVVEEEQLSELNVVGEEQLAETDIVREGCYVEYKHKHSGKLCANTIQSEKILLHKKMLGKKIGDCVTVAGKTYEIIAIK